MSVYLKAAEMIYTRERVFSCSSIRLQEFHPPYPRTNQMASEYRKLFKPSRCADKDFWLRGKFETEEEAKEWRVLALLFMHWITEGEK